MNKYFCNVGESLKKKIPNKPNPLLNGIYNVNRDSKEFLFSEISEEEIISIISTFKTSKGSGPDSIPNFFIKIVISVIARPLAFLFNSSLFQGVFPDNWKHARVSPIFKDGSTEELSNYRPISVLPFLSRLFEKLVYCRLYKYLDHNGLIYRHQSGFRSLHSVASCLLSNTNEWYQNIDNNKLTGLAFIDLKKAFDTVDTKLLLEKLAHYGIRNVEQRWFASYLTSRRQFCRVNDKSSSIEYISCGVPQGSCLGPLLFLLFINDMPYSLTKVKVNVYADDTSLTYSDVKLDNVTQVINSELEELKEWLQGNKLSLNIDKTTSMIIGTKRKLTDENGENLLPNFTLDGETIQHKNATKYLGVQIDNQLKWKDHISQVSSKVVRAIGYIKYARKFLPRETLRMLYLGLVEPHFRYCCSVWGSCGTVLRQKIEKLQNRAVRIITFSPYNAKTSPLLKHLKLPSIQDMIQQETVGMVYKAISNQAPEYLSVLFNRVSVMTGRTIRNANINLRPPRLNTTLAHNCFAHRGALLWNSLPTEIKSAKSFESFKNSLKNQQHLSVDVNIV